MNAIKKVLKNPYKLICWGVCRIPILYKKMSDESYLKLQYRSVFGRKLNLDNPKYFNEKLQWLKLYDRKPEYTKMVDKYEAKKYVADLIGEEYIIPTLGVWDKFEDIDFDDLPDQFVLKTTHDSGGVVICEDKSKFDMESAKRKLSRSLKNNFYYQGREWPYKDVKPRIIAEQFVKDNLSQGLHDYKFFCFHGKVKMILVCSERFSSCGLKEDFYDVDWKHLGLKRPLHGNSKNPAQKPASLNLMVEIAETLSKNIPFVRVDLYQINDSVYFGEITFFPASGFEGFEPDSWEKVMGDWIELP